MRVNISNFKMNNPTMKDRVCNVYTFMEKSFAKARIIMEEENDEGIVPNILKLLVTKGGRNTVYLFHFDGSKIKNVEEIIGNVKVAL